MLLRHRLYDAWLVVGRAIDTPAHRIGLHCLDRVGLEEGGERLLLVEVRIEPQLVVLGLEYHRHPVVYGSYHIIGIGRDNGGRAYLGAVVVSSATACGVSELHGSPDRCGLRYP